MAEIDPDTYELALAEARTAEGLTPDGLNLAFIATTPAMRSAMGKAAAAGHHSPIIDFDWDPNDHPRDILGKFKEALGQIGRTDDTIVKIGSANVDRSVMGHFRVNGKKVKGIEEAARKALEEGASHFDDIQGQSEKQKLSNFDKRGKLKEAAKHRG